MIATAKIEPNNVDTLVRMRAELLRNATVEHAASTERFFKEPVQTFGVKLPEVKKIASRYFKEMKHTSIAEFKNICERLFASQILEEGIIAAQWVDRRIGEFTSTDIIVFEKWIDMYIDNWAVCDSFCNHAVGSLVMSDLNLLEKLDTWCRSENRWLRRAAAVSLIIPARKGLLLDTVLRLADNMLVDTEDMVQKGYGWLLKEASRKHPKEIYIFVTSKKDIMPRTSYRYAIEKLPEPMRNEAMKR